MMTAIAVVLLTASISMGLGFCLGWYGFRDASAPGESDAMERNTRRRSR